MWKVPYKKGTLIAIGKDGGRTLSQDTLSTNGKPSRLAVNCDRKTVTDNGYDLVHVEVSIEDKKGNKVVDMPSDIRLILDDKLELAGLDNGSASIDDLNIRNNSVRTYNGSCLFVLRTIKGKKGTSSVMVVGDGGIQGRCKIHIQ
jgi:beta-galactosidase